MPKNGALAPGVCLLAPWHTLSKKGTNAPERFAQPASQYRHPTPLASRPLLYLTAPSAISDTRRCSCSRRCLFSSTQPQEPSFRPKRTGSPTSALARWGRAHGLTVSCAAEKPASLPHPIPTHATTIVLALAVACSLSNPPHPVKGKLEGHVFTLAFAVAPCRCRCLVCLTPSF